MTISDPVTIGRRGLGRRSGLAAGGGLVVLLAAAVLVPVVVTNNFWIHTLTSALLFVVLGSAFNLVFGKVGALSLAQPLFYAFGAYGAALGSLNLGWDWWVEILVMGLGAVLLGVLVGIPSFRLSEHTFAIGTLGFALIGQLVAMNWMDVTKGPLCLAGIPDLRIPLPWGAFEAVTTAEYFYVALGLAVVVLALLALLYRSRLGRIFSAVRDDPVLASARGMSPTGVRLTAFGIGAGITAIAGVFAAHFQRVVCPTQGDIMISNLLIIILLLGGIGSAWGVVVSAIAVTVLPQALRLADEWRMVIFSALVLVFVIFLPKGLAGLMEKPLARLRALLDRRGGADRG